MARILKSTVGRKKRKRLARNRIQITFPLIVCGSLSFRLVFEFWRQIRNCDFLNTHISIGRSKNSSKDTKRAYYLWYTICAGLFIFVRIALVFGRFHLPYRYNIHAFWRFHSVVAHSKSERTIERPNERASVWVSKRASERASEQSVSTIICAVAVVCVCECERVCVCH